MFAVKVVRILFVAILAAQLTSCGNPLPDDAPRFSFTHQGDLHIYKQNEDLVVLDPPGDVYGEPVYSSGKVAVVSEVVSEAGLEFNLYVSNVIDSDFELIVEDMLPYSEAQFSSDGSMLMLDYGLSYPMEDTTIIDIATGQMFDGPSLARPDWNPTNENLVAGIQWVTSPTSSELESPVFGIYTLDGSGSIALAEINLYASFAWSPDGNYLAYEDYDGRIRVVNSDGTGGKIVSKRAYEFGYHKWKWSPDGSKLGFSLDRNGAEDDVAYINMETGKVTIVACGSGFDWLTDGILLIEQRQNGSKTIAAKSIYGPLFVDYWFFPPESSYNPVTFDE